jgi:hypothetical protein
MAWTERNDYERQKQEALEDAADRRREAAEEKARLADGNGTPVVRAIWSKAR